MPSRESLSLDDILLTLSKNSKIPGLNCEIWQNQFIVHTTTNMLLSITATVIPNV